MIKKTDAQGRLHCEDGPAVIADDGSCVWYNRGLIHREDGPAVRLVFGDGRIEEQFWHNGKEIQ